MLIQAKVAVEASTFGAIGGKLYGPDIQPLILTSMLSQIGFVAIYIMFTSEKFRALLKNASHVNVNRGTIIFIEFMLYISMSFVRKMKRLTPATMIANVFILSSQDSL